MRIRFDNVEVAPDERQLLIDGRVAAVGARAFDLLLALIERRERVVGKNELLDLVWPGLVVEENNLQVHISALRKLLGPQTITTIPGRGYRFTSAIDGAVDAALAGSPAPATPAPAAGALTVPGNLPRHLPPLYGRDSDLRAVVALVEAHPLVTIVGAPGMGKTALALSAADVLRSRWRDGAWLVELAPIADPAQVPHAVAQVLTIALRGPETAQDQLAGILASQNMLLVLDNCEHVIDAVSALAEAVVTRADGVRLLVTSQELLNVPRETLFKLRPLAVPSVDQPADVEQFGALRLFVERARTADPRFILDAGNAGAVADICRQLDGLPLAIELAAARVRVLGVTGVRDRLGERFRVLTGGARTAMRRHQTLHAALDWSNALLAEEEQAVLYRLGVFVGGFTLDLAQRVAADERIDEWGVLEALSGLVDKSLVTADPGEPPRYRLLETTRAYALEKLADAGATASMIERHARALAELFLQTEDARFGERGVLHMDAYMQRLAPELDNVRAALTWALGEAGDLSVAVALTGASGEVFRVLGLAREALMLFDSVRRRLRDEPDKHVDPALTGLFWQRFCVLGAGANYPKSVILDAATRAEKICREAGSRRRLFRALIGKAWALATFGQGGDVDALVPEITALEDPSWPAFMRCLRLNLLSAVCGQRGQSEANIALLNEQRRLMEHEPGEGTGLFICMTNQCLALVGLERYDEAIALARELISRRAAESHQGISFLLQHLTSSLVFLGRLDEASRAVREAIPHWRRAGNFTFHGVVLALLLARKGRHADAARLDGGTMALLRSSGVEHLPVWRRAGAQLEQAFTAAGIAPSEIERWRREGEQLDEAALAALCL